jgi:hypothetical protein
MSDKTVAQKLLIKAGYRVLIANSPAGYAAILGELPDGVTVLNRPEGKVDLAQIFVASQGELDTNLRMAKSVLRPGGLLWVTYPKGTAKIKADVNRDTIAAFARTNGLQAVAMVSVDDTWSALRLKVIA